MKDALKQTGKLIGKAITFGIIYYWVFLFISIATMSFFDQTSLLISLLNISFNTVVTLLIFYIFGRCFSIKSSKLYWNIGFSALVFAWGTVSVLVTDIDKMLKGTGALLMPGAAMPLYMLLEYTADEQMNYYKYILIIHWGLVAAVIFFGSHISSFEAVRKKKIKIIAAIALAVIAISIPMPKVIDMLIPRMYTEATYPKIDGATAAIPLGERLSRELLGKDILQAKYFVKFNTTHNAYVNLVNKNADIIFAAEPSEEELKLSEEAGIKMKLTPIGMDAFVFIVNKNNKIDNLSVDEIRKIYSGEVTNWRDLGGKDEEIIAYQRPENSRSQTLMENVVMKGLIMMEPPTERIPALMGDMINVISYKNSENAIGYTVYYYANEMNKNENIKFLSVNGVPCNKDTIREKEYPFSGPIYAITRENDENESVKKLLDYLVSEKGQKTVEKGGFVPLQQ